jgi:hypothetical protein
MDYMKELSLGAVKNLKSATAVKKAGLDKDRD